MLVQGWCKTRRVLAQAKRPTDSDDNLKFFPFFLTLKTRRRDKEKWELPNTNRLSLEGGREAKGYGKPIKILGGWGKGALGIKDIWIKNKSLRI